MKGEKLIRRILKVLHPTSLGASNAIESSAVQTHTGQVCCGSPMLYRSLKAFDPRDYRSARFMQSPKYVSPTLTFVCEISVPFRNCSNIASAAINCLSLSKFCGCIRVPKSARTHAIPLVP